MAYRGRGRGGRGSFNPGSFAKQEKYEVFPEIKEYPVVNLKQKEEFRKLILCADKLRKFWISSAYNLDDLDKNSERDGGVRKPPLSDYMKMTNEYVPAELAVTKNVRRSSKRIRWDLNSDLQKLDFFEKLDQGPQGDDGEKEKKEDEDDEDEDDENVEEEEDDSGDDYDQNPDFDDDEDDFNMEDDGGDDEGYY